MFVPRWGAGIRGPVPMACSCGVMAEASQRSVADGTVGDGLDPGAIRRRAFAALDRARAGAPVPSRVGSGSAKGRARLPLTSQVDGVGGLGESRRAAGARGRATGCGPAGGQPLETERQPGDDQACQTPRSQAEQARRAPAHRRRPPGAAGPARWIRPAE